MFTGIIQQLATVASLKAGPQGARLSLLPEQPWMVEAGESVAVDGCCLTALAATGLEFDLSPETLQRSTLGTLKPGAKVNLERALRMGDALGGHLVGGHVDHVGKVVAVKEQGENRELRFSAPAAWMPLVAEKASVCVNGVSLTPWSVDAEGFSVALIPHTLSQTNLGALREGDPVNLEADLLARYVARMLGKDAR